MTIQPNPRMWTLASWSVVTVSVLLLAPNTAAQAQAPGSLTITASTVVTGRPDVRSPFAMIGNLDDGDFVAGRTNSLDANGNFVSDTFVSFVWSAPTGMLVADRNIDPDPHVHVPTDVSTTGTCVGWAFFLGADNQQPFAFVPANGFTFLPTPRTAPGPPGSSTPFQGFAWGVSDDGLSAVGTVQVSPSNDVGTMATLWTFNPRGPRVNPTLNLLDTEDASSNAWEINQDGTVIVGDSGSDRANLAATRWVNGVQQQLDVVGTSSTARLTSADGSVAIGWSRLAGSNVLVKWDAFGTANVFTPPNGTRIEALHAITADGTAVAGVLSADDPTAFNFENWAPFVWSDGDGFVVIPEAGLEDDYDFSQAFDITDDGSMVVGQLREINGTAPSLGFIWTREGGQHIVNDLLAASELASPTMVSSAYAVSGDGLRVLGTGNQKVIATDTDAVIMDIVRN